MKGMFITFEGIDGCGKTTQMSLLAEWLQKKGYEVIITREPGAKGLGEKIRNILLHHDGEVSSKAESFLFLADRAQNVNKIVNPAIELGKIVLCDRHTDSTIAYQGYGRGENIDELKFLNDLAVGNRKPDITFVFDIDVETSIARVGKEKDRMESAGKEFFEKVRCGYLEIAQKEPCRVKVINSNRSILEIQKSVMDYVENLITSS